MGLFKRSKDKKENLLDLGLTDNTIKLKDQDAIAKYLLPNENVEAALQADFNDILNEKKESTFVLTDKRVLIIKRGIYLMNVKDFKVFEYSNISSISYEAESTFSVWGELTLKTSNSDLKVKVFRPYLKQLSDIITKHVTDSQQNESAPTESRNVDIADQIKKLADLKEQGILTEEEFIVQKQKLLLK
jgi:hypothetical protein